MLQDGRIIGGREHVYPADAAASLAVRPRKE
jgi:hypothetical protein